MYKWETQLISCTTRFDMRHLLANQVFCMESITTAASYGNQHLFDLLNMHRLESESGKQDKFKATFSLFTHFLLVSTPLQIFDFWWSSSDKYQNKVDCTLFVKKHARALCQSYRYRYDDKV